MQTPSRDNQPLASLQAESGPLAGQIFAVDSSPYTLGRSTDNNLVVADSPVSRRHAQLELHDNRWFVRDLESSNGTFLNRQPLKGAQLLNSGDLISLGETILLFTIPPGLAAQSSRPAAPPAGRSAARPRNRWLLAAIMAVALILLVAVVLLLAGGLQGKTQPEETGPGLPGITLPTGLPDLLTGLPSLPTGLPALPSGLPTGLELPTGLALPTGLPELPGGLPTGLPKLP